MKKETEIHLPSRSIQSFSEIVPHPTPQTEAQIRHMQNLAGLVGIHELTDTLKPFFTYEREHTYAPEKAVYTKSLVPTTQRNVTTKDALSISQQLLSGMTWHYAFMHNERFSVPSAEPLHGEIKLPFSVRWENNAYQFMRTMSRERYEKAMPEFLDSLFTILPVAMEKKIGNEINEFKLGI